MNALRRIEAITLARGEAQAAVAMGSMPILRMVDPAELYVEASYQRDLGVRNLRTIADMVRDWRWDHFKPPICAQLEDGSLVVIDGQHTAIAAATHPDITEIPVMVNDHRALDQRAQAFIGQNRRRINVSTLEVYRAGVVGGDPVDAAVDAALRATGVKLVKPNAYSGRADRETIAISALRKVAALKGKAGLQRVLRIIIDAGAAPIPQVLILAVSALLYDDKWGVKDDAALAKVISEKTADEWGAYASAAMPGEAKWHAVAIAIFRRLPQAAR